MTHDAGHGLLFPEIQEGRASATDPDQWPSLRGTTKEVRFTSPLIPGEIREPIRQQWGRADNISSPMWDRQAFAAVLKEAEGAVEEAAGWDWPSPPLAHPATGRTAIPAHTAVNV